MTTQYAPVKAEYINPFLTSAATVFSTMLNCTLKRGTPQLREDYQLNHEISGVIGLTGKARGTVVVTMDREMAISATEALLGDRPAELDADVVDTIGELTNMIAGTAKTQLAEFQMSISMPNVVIGVDHSVQFPSGVLPISIPFDCEWGRICVDVGLSETISGS